MMELINTRKQEWLTEKDVFYTCILVGLLSHGYMMLNKLPNIDDYVTMFHYGLGYPLGRWFLALMGNFMFRIDGTYSLPLLNGAFFLFMLALSITIFLKPFHFEGKWTKRIFAALFVSFPTVTSTMSFMFTAPFYGISILFMAIAFYLLIQYKYGFLCSIILICCSLGIYQAYWGLIAAFLLLYLIASCLEDNKNDKEIILLSLKSFFSLLSGVLVYLIVNNFMLKIQKIELSDYQGVSNMGQFALSSIPNILKNAYGYFFQLTTDNYLYITWYPIIRVIIAIGYILTIIFCILSCIRICKRTFRLFAVIVFTLIFPLAINSIYILCNDASSIHTLMCYSVVLVFLIPFVFMNGTMLLFHKKTLLHCIRYAYICLLLLVITLYVRLANIYYLNLELAYHETNSFMVTLSTRIQETEGYSSDMPLYFSGLYSKSVNRNIWELRMVNHMHGSIDVDNVINIPLIRHNFSRIYLGNTFLETADPSIIEQNRDFIDAMPSYPDDGSIEIIEDTVIIKLSNS